jgi:hypothetical protein
VYQAQFCGDPTMSQAPQFCAPPAVCPPDSSFCTLPNDGSPNGFTDGDCCRDGYACQLIIGMMGLQRQAMGNSVLGFLDPGVNMNGTQVFTNTGFLPPPGAVPVLNTHDVSPEMVPGVRASLIFREPEWAVELTGFYLANGHFSHTTDIASQLDLGFAYFLPPTGFSTGKGGIFLQDSVATLQLQSQMWNGEANYRFNTAKNFEWILGVRYVGYSESFSVMTMRDVLMETGQYDPFETATINNIVDNHILTGQFGFETEFQLTERIGVGFMGKAGYGVDFADYSRTFIRGDGFYGPGVHRSETQFSQVYDISAYFDFCITEQFKIRAGYECLWLVDVPLPTSELNFDLTNTGAPFNRNGSVFFSGPMLEIQFVF